MRYGGEPCLRFCKRRRFGFNTLLAFPDDFKFIPGLRCGKTPLGVSCGWEYYDRLLARCKHADRLTTQQTSSESQKAAGLLVSLPVHPGSAPSGKAQILSKLTDLKTRVAEPMLRTCDRCKMALALIFAVSLSVGSPARCVAYAVLAHEAIVDSAWSSDIQPLLLKRFTPSSQMQRGALAAPLASGHVA